MCHPFPIPLSSSTLIHFRREGPQAKYHYLICGVQGDFTQGLVSNPPTHLWTRQLKVRLRGQCRIATLLKLRSAVCRSLEHFDPVPQGYPRMHGNRNRCSPVHVPPGVSATADDLRATPFSDWVPTFPEPRLVIFWFAVYMHAFI
jgi:hypothetical protein